MSVTALLTCTLASFPAFAVGATLGTSVAVISTLSDAVAPLSSVTIKVSICLPTVLGV